MSLSLEGLPLLILFLLPGFFAYQTRQNIRPSRKESHDTFELGLLILGYSSIISLTQALLFLIFLRFFDNSYYLGVVTKPFELVSTRPIMTTGLILAWTILSLTIAILVGIKDPYIWLLNRLTGENFLINDLWFELLTDRTSTNTDAAIRLKSALATVRLDDKQVYYGYLDKFEAVANEADDRIFTLKNPVLLVNDKPKYVGDNGYVILNTRDVKSIELTIQENES